MPVNPWGGTYAGLKSLDDTFGDLTRNKQWDEQQARQARIDVLQEPGIRAAGEAAQLSLEEQRRNIGNLRDYEERRKALESDMATATLPVDVPNPDYKAAVPAGLNSTMTYAGEANQTVPAQPAQGLPTMQGSRPLNQTEMASKRMMLSMEHGRYDDIAKIGNIMDVTDKIQGNQSAQLAKMVANAKANRQIIGVEAATAQLKREAAAAGIPPQIVDSIQMNRDGIIYYPDGQGGMIAILETPDGKSHVQHVQAKEPKSPTEWDIRAKAAAGDPIAKKALRDEQADKERLKRIEAGSGTGGGPAYVPGAPVGVPGERNEAILKGLPVGEAETVKMLADYRMPLPAGFALKAPYFQRLLGLTAQYDPSFDSTQYNVRLKLKNDFNSGKAAANIRSLNTAISHLETLKKKGEALQNSWSPTWNRVANIAYTAAGDPRVQGWETGLNAVAGELATVFKSTSGTDQEIKSWKENSHNFNSPAQIDETINTATELLGGRLQALQNQYETGMGRPKDFHFLSDKSRGILKKLGTDPDAWDSVSGKVGAGTAVPGVGAPGRAAPAPAGATHTAIRNPDGSWNVEAIR